MKRTSFCFCVVCMILLSIFLVFIHDVDRRGQERAEQLKAEVVQAVKERDDTRSELDALKAESSKSINEREKVQEDAAQQRNTLREQLRQVRQVTQISKGCVPSKGRTYQRCCQRVLSCATHPRQALPQDRSFTVQQ